MNEITLEQWKQVADMWFIPFAASAAHIAATVGLPFSVVVYMIDVLRAVHPVLHGVQPD